MAKKAEATGCEIKGIDKRNVTFRIVGTSPLIQHQWGAKAKLMMLEKKQGKKTKTRTICDPEAECIEATYRTDNGEYGVPLTAIKGSIICAAHNDLGIPKTLVMKALFIPCDDSKEILSMECSEPVMREDTVRIGPGSADLRYRPEFREWSVVVKCEIDAGLLQVKDLLTLVDRAGFGVGIGEWRPEKKGDKGRFKVDPTFPVVEEAIK